VVAVRIVLVVEDVRAEVALIAYAVVILVVISQRAEIGAVIACVPEPIDVAVLLAGVHREWAIVARAEDTICVVVADQADPAVAAAAQACEVTRLTIAVVYTCGAHLVGYADSIFEIAGRFGGTGSPVRTAHGIGPDAGG
jgi:hypothetical protein